MPNKYDKKCIVEGCQSKGRVRTMCKLHYAQWRRSHPNYRPHVDRKRRVDLEVNPFRCLWEERKGKGLLCEEWSSLRAFAEGVAPKPEGYFTLCRIRGDEPYGPNNFLWRAQIKRREGESRREFVKRQRTEQITRHPNFERERELRRKYGLTSAQFKAMHDAQDGKCAICGQLEMRVEFRTGNYRNLAIDHCHDTGKVRELLCWECNVTLGRMGESVERLEAMIRYIKKHAHPAPQLKLVGG